MENNYFLTIIVSAAANVSNIGFTRIEELTKGATVKDGEGNVSVINRTLKAAERIALCVV